MSPESVTVHEAGHQFWYGLVGNNEFEEAWLDEGFNSYHDEKAQRIALGPEGWGTRYFGVNVPGRGQRSGIAGGGAGRAHCAAARTTSATCAATARST